MLEKKDTNPSLSGYSKEDIAKFKKKNPNLFLLEYIEDPLKQRIAKVIIENELGATGEHSPYVISFAGTGEDGKGKSGLSFGHLQFDIANNSAAQALLEEILDSYYEKGYYAKHEQN